jgi:regulator of protease activity HflC (stomatin/prohibitin superfamily)
MSFDKLVVSFFVDEIAGGFFVNVPPGHVACVHDLGRGVLPKIWGPGLHFKIPFWQKAKLFNAQILEYMIRHGFDLSQSEALGDEEIQAITLDKQLVTVEGSILFKIDRTRAPELWENIGEKFVSKVVRPVSRSRIRTILATFPSEDLLSKRLQLERRIKDELNSIFLEKGLIIDSVLLSNIKVLGEVSRDLVTRQDVLVGELVGEFDETSSQK